MRVNIIEEEGFLFVITPELKGRECEVPQDVLDRYCKAMDDFSKVESELRTYYNQGETVTWRDEIDRKIATGQWRGKFVPMIRAEEKASHE